MNNFTSFSKLSKKEQEKINKSKRKDWGDISPVTKVVPSGKAYNRKSKHPNKDFDER